MRIAYNSNNGKVFRVLHEGVPYKMRGLSQVAYVTVEKAGNVALLAALEDRPDKFTYDSRDAKFVEALEPTGTQDWPINTDSTTAKSGFQSRDAAAAKSNAQSANSVPQLRASVAELWDIVSELQKLHAD